MKYALLAGALCIPFFSFASSVKLIDDFSEGVITNLVSSGGEITYLDQTVDNVVGDDLFAKSRREAVSKGTLSIRPGGANQFNFSGSELFSNCEISYGKEMFYDAVSIYQSYESTDIFRITFADGFEPSGTEFYYEVILRSGAVTTDDVFELLTPGTSSLDIPLSNFSAVDLNDISGISVTFFNLDANPVSVGVDKFEIISPERVADFSISASTCSMVFTNLNAGSSYAILTSTNLLNSSWTTSVVFEAGTTYTNWSHGVDTPTRMFKFDELP